MTDVQYNDSENEDEEKKDKKEKSVAFKASSSSYKSMSKKEASSEDDDEFDDEAMALLVRKMGKFIKKKGYGARKRRDHMKEHVRLCFECKSPDHIAADCPHKRNDDENEKRKKKDKKEKEKKMTFKKKKGSDHGWTKSSLSWLGGSVQKCSDWTHLSFKMKMT
jgi:hypothetical protein